MTGMSDSDYTETFADIDDKILQANDQFELIIKMIIDVMATNTETFDIIELDMRYIYDICKFKNMFNFRIREQDGILEIFPVDPNPKMQYVINLDLRKQEPGTVDR